MATYYRGVVTTGTFSAQGLFQTRGFSTTMEKAIGEDERGNVAEVQNFNGTKTGTIEMVLDTSATAVTTFYTLIAAAGSTPVTVTIGTEKFVVDSLNENESNKALKRLTVAGTRYLKNGIPA